MDYQASQCGDESGNGLEMRLFVVVCRVVCREPGVLQMPRLPDARSKKEKKKKRARKNPDGSKE